MDCGPFETAAIGAYPTYDAWLAEAPALLAAALRRWDLAADAAYVGGVAASVLKVRQPDGQRAVLKVGYPHPEAIWEAVGLQAFPAGCAPAVLRQDPWTWTMLLSPVDPGLQLSTSGLPRRDALRAGGMLRARLSAARAPTGVPLLADAMRDYAHQATDRLDSQAGVLVNLGVQQLVVSAIEQFEQLAASGDDGALLHGDFNPGNILSSSRKADTPWIVIDPKPLVGDPAYDLWPLITQVGRPYESADPAGRLAEQTAIAAEAAECDPARAALWSWARTALNVSWHLADGNPEFAAAEARALKAWADVVRY